MGDHAAERAEDVAALFPVPNAEVADRLVSLLLPRESAAPKSTEAA